MQAEPVFMMPSWFLLFSGGLVLVALLLGASVLLAGRKMQVSRTGVLSFFQALLWIVPALAIVALIATAKRPESPTAVSEPVAARTSANPDLLQVRKTSSEVPDWARPANDDKKPGVVAKLVTSIARKLKLSPSSPNESIVYASDPFSIDDETALEIVTARVVLAVQEELLKDFNVPGDWKVPASAINQLDSNAFELVSVPFDKDFGAGTEKMHQLYARVEITPKLRETVQRDWKTQVVSYRLMRYGGGLGLTTILAAIVAGYLGLSHLTQGRYNGRLRLAALVGVLAAGVIGWKLLV